MKFHFISRAVLSWCNRTSCLMSCKFPFYYDTKLTCWFGRNKSCEKSGDWEMIHTTIGPCYSFRIRQPVRETGLFNGLYIKMELANTKSSSPFDYWFYYIHPHDVTPALNIYETQYATKNDALALGKFNTDVKVSYRQVLRSQTLFFILLVIYVLMTGCWQCDASRPSRWTWEEIDASRMSSTRPNCVNSSASVSN